MGTSSYLVAMCASESGSIGQGENDHHAVSRTQQLAQRSRVYLLGCYTPMTSLEHPVYQVSHIPEPVLGDLASCVRSELRKHRVYARPGCPHYAKTARPSIVRRLTDCARVGLNYVPAVES